MFYAQSTSTVISETERGGRDRQTEGSIAVCRRLACRVITFVLREFLSVGCDRTVAVIALQTPRVRRCTADFVLTCRVFTDAGIVSIRSVFLLLHR